MYVINIIKYKNNTSCQIDILKCGTNQTNHDNTNYTIIRTNKIIICNFILSINLIV